MKIVRGISINDPIIIGKKELDRNKLSLKLESFNKTQSDSVPSPKYPSTDVCINYLDVLFGGFDGNYFIQSQSTLLNEKGTYKIFNVQDIDSVNHTIYFLIK